MLESLRNNLAHSQDIISCDWETIVELCKDMERVIHGTEEVQSALDRAKSSRLESRMMERNDIQVGRGHAGVAKHFADGVFHDPHGPLEDRAAIHSEELAFECEGGPRDGAGVTWACGTAGNRAGWPTPLS